jgi:hypothetical protein
MSSGVMTFALPAWSIADDKPVELEIGGERLVL